MYYSKSERGIIIYSLFLSLAYSIHKSATGLASKKNILYVDDEKDNLIAFKAVFRRHFNVLTSLSADEAINVLGSASIDMVLTDQRMPGMTGVELCQYIKGNYPMIPCLIITGYPDLSVIDHALGEGHISKFITKPWDPTNLRQEIEASIV